MLRKIIIATLFSLGTMVAVPSFAAESQSVMTIGTNFVPDYCLEVSATNTLYIAKCNGKPNQNLEFTKGDNGQLKHGNMCVGVTRHGEPLVLKNCEASNEFDWGFNEDGTMSNLNDDCADILNFKSDIGTPVIAWDCTATDNQKFFPKRVTVLKIGNDKEVAKKSININGTPIVASYYAQGQCLETTLRGTIIINNCNTSDKQKLYFASGASGKITNGSKCLASGDKGTPLAMKTCSSSANQNWSFRANGTLGNGANICADIFAFLTRAGTDVIAWDCTATENQKFYPALGVDSGSVNFGSAYASSLKSNEGTTTISITPNFSFANMTGSGGFKINANDNGNIVGGQNGVIILGGAGVYTTRYPKGLASAAVKEATIGGTDIIPANWDFFSGDKAGQITIIQ